MTADDPRLNLVGTRVRFIWPDGTLSGGAGTIIHVSWGEEDGRRPCQPGFLVNWDPPPAGAWVPEYRAQTYVPELSWLAREREPK